jgi:hypothetical protein
MSASRRGLCVLLALGALGAGGAPEAPKPEIDDLGNGRYRVGPVEVDKAQGRFTVPGHVLRAEPPLEFLAVAKGGRKAYEAMLELDATAFEFNLACILIGLDGEHATGRPTFHFDPQAVDGDGVGIEVSWDGAGGRESREAASLLKDGDRTVPEEWVYTGSEFTRNGAYLAHIDGTLIGLVHDPSSVIEHHGGLGINTYGSITATAGAPSAQTRVVLTVQRLSTDHAESANDEDLPPATPQSEAPDGEEPSNPQP